MVEHEWRQFWKHQYASRLSDWGLLQYIVLYHKWRGKNCNSSMNKTIHCLCLLLRTTSVFLTNAQRTTSLIDAFQNPKLLENYYYESITRFINGRQNEILWFELNNFSVKVREWSRSRLNEVLTVDWSVKRNYSMWICCFWPFVFVFLGSNSQRNLYPEDYNMLYLIALHNLFLRGKVV